MMGYVAYVAGWHDGRVCVCALGGSHSLGEVFARLERHAVSEILISQKFLSVPIPLYYASSMQTGWTLFSVHTAPLNRPRKRY